MKTAIPGFYLYNNLIDDAFERQLLSEIDAQRWIVDYARRLQYYGYRNELEEPYNLIPFPVVMPPLVEALSKQLVAENIIESYPDQVIVNEYVPGEGIRPHKDRDYYENQICGVNLGSGCIMRFIRGNNQEVIDIEVPRRSIYVMQDDARKKWKHSIPPRKKDVIDGMVKIRDRRISITYRQVKPHRVRPINLDGKVAKMLKDDFNIENVATDLNN